MITAEEARKLSKNSVWKLQLEQIEQGIKTAIILGGNHIYYKSDKLHPDTIEFLRILGYIVEPHVKALLVFQLNLASINPKLYKMLLIYHNIISNLVLVNICIELLPHIHYFDLPRQRLHFRV